MPHRRTCGSVLSSFGLFERFGDRLVVRDVELQLPRGVAFWISRSERPVLHRVLAAILSHPHAEVD
jgi:hypothetical protein